MFSNPQVLILCIDLLNSGLFPLLIAYQSNLFCQIASPLVFCNAPKILVAHPVVGSSPVLEYCSLAGRLNSRSASINVLLGLWKNTNSLFGCVSTNSYSNSSSNSPPTLMLVLSFAVKIVEIGTLVT